MVVNVTLTTYLLRTVEHVPLYFHLKVLFTGVAAAAVDDDEACTCSTTADVNVLENSMKRSRDTKEIPRPSGSERLTNLWVPRRTV